jgi:hypothetical protein
MDALAAGVRVGGERAQLLHSVAQRRISFELKRFSDKRPRAFGS